MSSYFVWVQALYGSQIHGLDHACCNTIIDVVMWSRPFYITSLLQFLHADTGSFMQRVAWHALNAQAGAERYACYKLHYTMLATSHTTLCLLQANKEKYCGILCKSGRGQDGLLTSDQSCLLQLVVLRKALCLCESFCGSCIEYIDSLQTI